MTRPEFEAAVREELDKLRTAPQESKFQHWLDSVYEGPSREYSVKALRKLAEQFRTGYCTERAGPIRRGSIPSAPEDG